MMGNKYYPRSWKYSVGCIDSDFYNSEKFESSMYNLVLEPEDYYRETIAEIGNVDLYCRDIKLHTLEAKRWINGKRTINYDYLYHLYNHIKDTTICVYRSEAAHTPRKLMPPETIVRSIEWFIREGIMSYEYISWGTHINEGTLRRWIDDCDFRGLTYSKLKRICDFVLDRLDKNIMDDDDRDDEILILLP